MSNSNTNVDQNLDQNIVSLEVVPTGTQKSRQHRERQKELGRNRFEFVADADLTETINDFVEGFQLITGENKKSPALTHLVQLGLQMNTLAIEAPAVIATLQAIANLSKDTDQLKSQIGALQNLATGLNTGLIVPQQFEDERDAMANTTTNISIGSL